MKRILKLAVIALSLSALAALASCSKSNAEQEAEDDSESLIQAVRVEQLSKTDMRKFIEVNGNIRAEKSMSVYPVIQGKITSTCIHLGSSVKKGDVLAYADPSVPGSRYSLNEVTSPISGTVISIPLKEGTRVDTETSVVTIGDLSKLQIITYVPERYVSFLRLGLDADVVLEAYPDEKFSAVVSEVSPVLDEETRTKEVILTFVANDSRVNAGMFANVNLYLKTYEGVFSVPTSCIVEKADKKYVWIIDDTADAGAGKAAKVRFVEIKTSEEIIDRTIIELAGTDSASTRDIPFRVVTQGFETLQNGSEVNIAE